MRVACGLPPGICRREHIARRLEDAEQDGEDFEARCPVCGHGGFRISKAAIRKYRHIWTCACKRCGRGRGCSAGILRVYLLRLDVAPGCLGLYDGAAAKEIGGEVARLMDRAISDILATPRLRPADMRLVLAEAQGRKVPDEFKEFVKFARSLGVGKTQAQEAAARWGCRPPDCPPLTGGGVVDTSRNTGAVEAVKRASSEPRGRSESDQSTVGIRPADETDTGRSGAIGVPNVRRSETDRQNVNDKNRRPAA